MQEKLEKEFIDINWSEYTTFHCMNAIRELFQKNFGFKIGLLQQNLGKIYLVL